MENENSNKLKWADEFGADYFDPISHDVVNALSLLDDNSWCNEFLPRFIVGVAEVSGVSCELFAYVGFDMDSDGNQDKSAFTFSLSVAVYGSEPFELTEEIQELFPNIKPSCPLNDIELLNRNNAAIIDFINGAKEGFPVLVTNYLEQKLSSNETITKD